MEWNFTIFRKPKGQSSSSSSSSSSLSSSSSSSSLSSTWLLEFVHAVPLHWPHAGDHSKSCLRQVHLALAQSSEQLHLIILRRDSGAADKSVITGTTWSTFTIQPQSATDMPSSSPLHCLIWRYTLWLWYLAAADVGGRSWCCICVLLVASFSQYLWYRIASSFSPGFPPKRDTNAFSPPSTTSSKEECKLNTFACSLKCAEWAYFFKAAGLSIPYGREVVSHPEIACRNSMLRQTS